MHTSQGLFSTSLSASHIFFSPKPKSSNFSLHDYWALCSSSCHMFILKLVKCKVLVCIFLSNSSVSEEFLTLEDIISAKIFFIALGEVNTGVNDLICHTSLCEKAKTSMLHFRARPSVRINKHSSCDFTWFQITQLVVHKTKRNWFCCKSVLPSWNQIVAAEGNVLIRRQRRGL